MADLIVKQSASRGRGVFAARGFQPGEVIEVCPVIALSADDAARLDATQLYDYYFGWGDANKGAAIALGFGSLYNHSYAPNAAYRKSEADSTISIIAVKPIAPDDEILIKYNYGDTENCGPLWFEVK
jgi:SET domain-containing protein